MRRSAELVPEEVLVIQIALHCLRRPELPDELQRHELHQGMVIDTYKSEDGSVVALPVLPPLGREKSTRLQVSFTYDDANSTVSDITCVVGDGEPSENWHFTLEVVDNQFVSELVGSPA